MGIQLFNDFMASVWMGELYSGWPSLSRNRCYVGWVDRYIQLLMSEWWVSNLSSYWDVGG